MAAVYAIAASRAHQNIFVVIRHADDFVGHDLADGENQIEAALRNQPIHLGRPRIVQLAFRLLADEFRRDLAESLNVGSPVMHAKKLFRDRAKHSRDLLRLHRSMRAESRQNRLESVAVILPRVAREVTGTRMHAALIRWHDENPVALSELRKTFHQQIVQPLER